MGTGGALARAAHERLGAGSCGAAVAPSSVAGTVVSVLDCSPLTAEDGGSDDGDDDDVDDDEGMGDVDKCTGDGETVEEGEGSVVSMTEDEEGEDGSCVWSDEEIEAAAVG